MFFRLIICTTIHQNYAQQHSSVRPYDLNITEYVLDLPTDLRNLAQQALRAEWNLAHARKWNSGVQCTPLNESETVPICPPNKYRLPTSECNNIRHRKWGTRGSPFIRLMKPQYSDGEFTHLVFYSFEIKVNLYSSTILKSRTIRLLLRLLESTFLLSSLKD